MEASDEIAFGILFTSCTESHDTNAIIPIKAKIASNISGDLFLFSLTSVIWSENTTVSYICQYARQYYLRTVYGNK